MDDTYQQMRDVEFRTNKPVTMGRIWSSIDDILGGCADAYYMEVYYFDQADLEWQLAQCVPIWWGTRG